MKYYHEIADNGNHRLGTSKYKRGDTTSTIKWGPWASYTAPAMLGQYLAVTEYYRGSVEFPDPTVLYRVQRDVEPLETR